MGTSHTVQEKIKHYKPNGTKQLIEIKPKKILTEPQNICKFNAAKQYVKENNMDFIILTEEDLK